MSHLKILHSDGCVTIAGEGMQYLGLCLRLRPLSREGLLSCHTCCDTKPRFLRSRPKDCHNLVSRARSFLPRIHDRKLHGQDENE